jgi:hypothetical protein
LDARNQGKRIRYSVSSGEEDWLDVSEGMLAWAIGSYKRGIKAPLLSMQYLQAVNIFKKWRNML